MTSKRTIWKEEEDDLLKKLVDENGDDDWNLISQQFNKVQKKYKRNPVQCKQRWTKNLCSKIRKAKWSKDEKEKLFKIFLSSQNKWVDISKHFKNRTDRDIKNNIYNSLRKGIRRICKIVKIDNGTNKVRDIKSKALVKSIIALDDQIKNQRWGFDLFQLIFEISLGNKKQKQLIATEGLATILKEKIEKLFNKTPTQSQQSSENNGSYIQIRTGSLDKIPDMGPSPVVVEQSNSNSQSGQEIGDNKYQEPLVPVDRIESISKFIRWQSK